MGAVLRARRLTDSPHPSPEEEGLRFPQPRPIPNLRIYFGIEIDPPLVLSLSKDERAFFRVAVDGSLSASIYEFRNSLLTKSFNSTARFVFR